MNGFTQSFDSKDVLGRNKSILEVNAGSGTVDDGNHGDNYKIDYETAKGTITPADYISIVGSKTYNGSAKFSRSEVTLTGVNNEIFHVAATANSANASSNGGATKFVSATGSIIGVSGADTGNYKSLDVSLLTGADNKATIGKADYVSIVGSKIYNGSAHFKRGEVTLTGCERRDVQRGGDGKQRQRQWQSDRSGRGLCEYLG